MIPTEEELLNFIKARDLVNFSTIAKFYNINNSTVSDIVDSLIHKKLVVVKKLGGSKIIRIK
ncbi:MarR family transcriptional regulator [Candidatus Woesearchaeota archaeon]|nr:MarR family transcriptional regulator [Candidatus Woesearchaeota archaeon]